MNKILSITKTCIPYIKGKWAHTGFQKYLRNTGWMFFGRIFTLGISFFIGIYIARYLGPSNYGLLSYVISFVGLFSFLTSFGIDNIVSREIIKDYNKKDELIGTAFYLKLIGSIVAIICIVIFSILTTKDIFTLGLIWLFSLNFIPQSFNILETYFQSQVLSKKVVLSQIISNFVSIILKIICISFGKGIFWLIIIYIIETTVCSSLLLFSFRHFGNHIKKWKFNFHTTKSLLSSSWPIMISSIAVGIYMKIDQVMIKNILNNEQAGIYAVAVKLSEIWYFIPGIIASSFLPALINAKKNNKTIYESRLQRLYSTVFWLSIIIALISTIFSRQIIYLLFGNQYIEAATTLKIYVWGGIGISIGAILNQYLLIENKIKINFILTMIGAVVNIVLNYILIPFYGINGAAFATFISYNISIIALFLFPKIREHIKIIINGIFIKKIVN